MKMIQRPLNWLVLAGAATGFPLYAAQMVTIDDASMVEQALAQQQYSMMPAASGFKAVNTVQLPNGKVKVRYQQMYNGFLSMAPLWWQPNPVKGFRKCMVKWLSSWKPISQP